MASGEVFDFAKLLAPIQTDAPAGIDVRADLKPDSDYQKVKEGYKSARETERRIDRGETELTPPDWREILKNATKVLAEQSKNMEVVAYLTEALVRLHGFAGLRDGYRLARELIEKYWDGLYPLPVDGEPIVDRFSHVLQLNGIESNGTLAVPIAKIPFTEKTGDGQFSMIHYQAAQSLGKITDAKVRQKRVEEGATTLEMIQKAVAETPAKFYTGLVEDIEQAMLEFRRFGEVLAAKSNFDPPSENVRASLEAFLDVVKDLAREKLKAVAPPPKKEPDGDGKEQPGQGDGDGDGAIAGAIRSREEALRQLLKIADFFRSTEPHSIIPYALEQVVHWGHMSLPDLLLELIPEEGPRKVLFKHVGIKAEPPKEAAKK